ncbi:hypothetical protein BB561_000549 [Smittium simulii]|uniref:Major facilitator superfamily (MFS) profile domain-containing protein n=1 Tax=Smittium simulii TaxID=133385 RepID=A0A2T9YYM4_9FUNG|nr:hypothetical protein BB561_000549 [Smittium simulii]
MADSTKRPKSPSTSSLIISSALPNMSQDVASNKESQLSEKISVPGNRLDTGYAWVILAASTLNFAIISGTGNSFGVFQEYFLNTMFVDSPASYVSLISSLSSAVKFSGGLLASSIIYYIGLRNTCILGTLLSFSGLFASSFCSTIPSLTVAFGVVYSLGAALLINCSIIAPSLWFGLFVESGYCVVSLYFSASLTELGETRTFASNSLMIACASIGTGRLFAPFFTKKLGVLNTLIITTLISGLSCFGLWLPTKSLPMYLIFIVVFGFNCGFYHALGPVLIDNFYDKAEISQVNGIMYLFLGSGSLITNPSVGVMFDKIGNRKSYTSLKIFCGLAFIMASILCFGLKRYIRKNHPSQIL